MAKRKVEEQKLHQRRCVAEELDIPLHHCPYDGGSGAYMGQFYGWERPPYFGKTAEPGRHFDRQDWFENVKAEVAAASQHAAVFDASSFGNIEVTGPDAGAFLLKVCAGYLHRAPGSVIYTSV